MADSSSNKRLAKNTLFLYFRMLFLMAVNLYTSRVTLQVLGVEDFGVYNVVSGIVVMFSFLARAMSGTCTRYMSVAIGKNDINEVQKIFSNSIVAHLFLMGIVLLLLETVGLWFVLNTINLPAGRETVANIVYQLAVLSICLNVIRIPFNSSIVANEHMNFYAYSSIVEGVLKLVIVWILLIVPFDKLVSYSFLLVANVAIINLWYLWYCRSHFEGNRLTLKVEKKSLKEMLTFSWWNTIGGLSDMAWQQGTNIILNMFHGVTLNATMGITNQVRTAVYSFVQNIQVAANPQIIKAYAPDEKSRFFNLIFATSKFSFYLMLLIAFPIILNVDFILELWLKTPPPRASVFTSLTMLFCIFDSVSGPLWTANQATGDVKAYNLWTSWLLLLNIPAAYFLFTMGFAPESMLVARIILMLLNISFQVVLTKKKTEMSIKAYLQKVFLPSIIVMVPTMLCSYFTLQGFDGWSKLILTLILNTAYLGVFIWILGTSKHEKSFAKNYISKFFNN